MHTIFFRYCENLCWLRKVTVYIIQLGFQSLSVAHIESHTTQQHQDETGSEFYTSSATVEPNFERSVTKYLTKSKRRGLGRNHHETVELG